MMKTTSSSDASAPMNRYEDELTEEIALSSLLFWIEQDREMRNVNSVVESRNNRLNYGTCYDIEQDIYPQGIMTTEG